MIQVDTRHRTVPVRVGALTVGGGAPIVVQSMTLTDTADAVTSGAQHVVLQKTKAMAVVPQPALQWHGQTREQLFIPLFLHFAARAAAMSASDGCAHQPMRKLVELLPATIDAARDVTQYATVE